MRSGITTDCALAPSDLDATWISIVASGTIHSSTTGFRRERTISNENGLTASFPQTKVPVIKL
jgi:hypothetical protein